MNGDPTAWHYVTLNEANRYPRRIVNLDTESYREIGAGTETHRFMLACASFDQIDPRTQEPKSTEWLETDEPQELWEWIGSKPRKRERTMVFAHNLGYDLRISQAFSILPELGWKLKFISLDSRRCYCKWARDGATLTFSDSTSYFPASLEKIAQTLGLKKTALPEIGDSPDRYYDRCRKDVEILRCAMLSLLQWLERNDCGNFKPTGAAQSFATFRHRFLQSRRLLVHHDQEALGAERRAAWTGRTEAWRHGQFDYPLYEYDYRLAYATIASAESVPCRFIGTQTLDGKRNAPIISKGYATLYECEVSTEKPLLPTEYNGKILWPAGRFATTLWDRELALLGNARRNVRVRQAFVYRTAPILEAWGRWILTALTDETQEIPEHIRLMLKHWARCLIGRFGMRYPDWRPVGRSGESDLAHFACYDVDTSTNGEYLQIGNDWYTCDEKRDGYDTSPAIMSYIMALQRVKMWEAIEAIGESEMIYCDTDSILTSKTGAQRLDKLRAQPGHDNLLPRGRYDHATIYGPRQIVLDGEPRIAGLSRRARQATRHSFKTEVWQSLSDSLKNGDPSSVHISPRTFTVTSTDHRRKHLPNGHTEPFRLPLPS